MYKKCHHTPVPGIHCGSSLEHQTDQAVYMFGAALHNSNSLVKTALCKADKAECFSHCAINEAKRATVNAKNAQKIAKKAQGTADSALNAAGKAQESADKAQGTADSALNAAGKAQESADKAQGTADSALNAAGKAQESADKAQGTADSALNAAGKAQESADKAQGTADSALNAAGKAQESADKAQGTADSALNAAGKAQESADKAQGTADSALNAAGKAQESADKAQGTADSALNAAGKAQESADKAQGTADSALNAAGKAQESADKAQGTADSALNAAGKAQESADKAQGTADSALNVAGKAQESADKAQGTADSALNAVEKVEETVKQSLDKTLTLLTKNTTWYVRPDGDDNNDGSADTPEKAFKTIQAAVDYVVTRFKFKNNIGYIKVAAGTYTGRVYLYRHDTSSETTIQLIGAGIGKTILRADGQAFVVYPGAQWTLRGFSVEVNNHDEIRSDALSVRRLGAITVRECSFTLNELEDSDVGMNLAYNNGGYVGFKFSGNEVWTFNSKKIKSRIVAIHNTTHAATSLAGTSLTVSGKGDAFVKGTYYGFLGVKGDEIPTIKGSFIGKRFSLGIFSSCVTHNQGKEYFPGTLEGTLASNAYYG